MNFMSHRYINLIKNQSLSDRSYFDGRNCTNEVARVIFFLFVQNSLNRYSGLISQRTKDILRFFIKFFVRSFLSVTTRYRRKRSAKFLLNKDHRKNTAEKFCLINSSNLTKCRQCDMKKFSFNCTHAIKSQASKIDKQKRMCLLLIDINHISFHTYYIHLRLTRFVIGLLLLLLLRLHFGFFWLHNQIGIQNRTVVLENDDC